MTRDRTGDLIDADTDAHSCDQGWAGHDTDGRPYPCLVCRPHLQHGHRPPAQRTRKQYQLAEKAWQAQVVAHAQAHGWRVDHHTTRGDGRGWPDLVLVKPGRMIVAELKSNTGRVDPQQAIWLQLFRTIPGVQVFVWRPAAWPEIRALLAAQVPAPAAVATATAQPSLLGSTP